MQMNLINKFICYDNICKLSKSVSVDITMYAIKRTFFCKKNCILPMYTNELNEDTED